MSRALRCLLLFLSANLLAGDARDEWAAITALDAGPGLTEKNTGAEVYTLSIAHNDKQEKALRAYLAAHPGDPNTFEALLRLARVLDLRSEMKAEAQSPEVMGLLEKASQLTTSAARQTEFEFALLARRMRKWRSGRPPIEERRALLEQARQFESSHPGDRRTASLLAEIASLFDFEPATKEALLLHVKKLTKDPDLNAQIADDLRRLGLLGKPLPLRFTALDGRRVDVKEWRGKVVIIVFFATWSAPSKAAFLDLRRVAEAAGPAVELAGISLDAERDALENFLRGKGVTAPITWDGKGWEGPLMRALGINSVPTAWLLDKNGVLRSLDALDDPDGQIRKLLGGK